MVRSFEGKVVLVPGSARGIGKTIAETFGRAGARIAICDINGVASEQTVQQVGRSGVEAKFFGVDLSKEGEPQRVVRDVAAEFGRLDVLVNNARAGERRGLADDTEQNWDLTISVGLKAAYFASQQAIPIMRTNGGGNIVNVSSVSAFLVSQESAAYHAAKAGLVQLTRYLAVRAGPQQVRVNTVMPGFIVQDEHRERYLHKDNAGYRARAEACHPLGKVGFARDVAETTLFLCSDSAQFINGHAVVVDGGFTVQDPWAVLHSMP